ncbi:hypothetical protein AGMMS50212_13580 [Spirochaetia bacterium]|nr:hypothetical protein AGMMS50212_13580 [Spirochaetia bacterium]
MDKKYFFERNLLALSRIDSELCSRLTMAETTLGSYRILLSRDQKKIPAYVDKSGAAHPLHSLVDPEKEAVKIASTLSGEGYIIIMGFGAGFLPEAATNNGNVKFILVIDYNIDSMAELLCLKDFAPLINDPRFHILVDADEASIEKYILNTYNPTLHDGIRAFPLRSRTDFDTEHFIPASRAIKTAIDKVSADFSVQSFFGKRWFSNIIRNIFAAEKQSGVFTPIRNAAICAAGPSLDDQLELIYEQRSEFFLIAADTSLGSLLCAGIKPDALISIDCQHISYYHFIGKNIQDIPLFLDLASPPLLASCSEKTFFFCGGHPLDKYISNMFRNFPAVDTSGANVTYAALSLAENLGAKNVKLFGADFSYPKGRSYTKNAYFYPFLTRKQNRLNPLESSTSSFILKIPSLQKIENGKNWYYETRPLKMYREAFENKAAALALDITSAQGGGAPVTIKKTAPFTKKQNEVLSLFSCGRPFCTAKEFLKNYGNNIEALPMPVDNNVEQYINKMTFDENLVLNTLLPSAAAIKHNTAVTTLPELIGSLKDFSLSAIEKIIK